MDVVSKTGDRSCTSWEVRVRYKEAGIRGTIHIMLVLQSHTEPPHKKGGKKMQWLQSGSMTSNTERNQERDRKCVYMCVMRETALDDDSIQSKERRVCVWGGRPLDTGVHSSSQRIHTHPHNDTNTRGMPGEDMPLNRIQHNFSPTPILSRNKSMSTFRCLLSFQNEEKTEPKKSIFQC